MAKAKKPAENPNQNCLEGMSCPLCGDFGPFKIFGYSYLSVEIHGAW